MIAFIPTENISKIKDFVEKANKKAKKYGLDGFEFELTGNTKLEKNEDNILYPFYVEFSEVNISGKFPKFSGWKLISKIEFIEGIGSILNTVPSEVLPEKYYYHDNICDHCGHKRERKVNYIIQNVETLEYKSIGSACLKMFLGGKTAESLIWYANMLKEIDELKDNEDFSEYSFGQALYPIQNVLELTLAAIKKYGWVSGSVAYDEFKTSTADTVKEFMFNKNRDFTLPFNKEDSEYVSKVVEYFVNVEPTNEYLINLKKFASCGYSHAKGFGYVCSMIVAYKKAMEITKEKENKSNEFVGTIGQKIEMELTYVKGISFQSYYGTSFIDIFNDEKGNTFVWITSKYIDIIEGMTYKVKGTIKEHKDYNGTNQTVLTRCKIKEF